MGTTEAAEPVDTGMTDPDTRGPALTHLALIEDKLSVPSGHSGMIRRTRLLRQLGAAGTRRIISISGPPGYGKTSVLAQWARAGGRPVAWLTVDDGDNDPIVLFTCLAAALDRLDPLHPGAISATSPGALSDRAVVARLLWAVAGRPPLLIVIDDAHRITARACLDALASFIAHVPEQVQVAIASRERIGLPFARWRSQAWLLDIRPTDLAMDADEVGDLLRHLRVELSAAETARLLERTEGWPALLGLAAAAAGRSGGRVLADPSAGHEIGDYLRSEVLERRSAAEIVFLTRTSILERLSAPVCDAVTHGRAGGRLLADLARSTILVDEYGGS
jgi:LuxR family maltose regulon positive regulatory protein